MPFLYRVLLQQDLVGIDAVRAKRSRYLLTRDTKGKESRVTMLPTRIVEPLQATSSDGAAIASSRP